MSFLNKLLKIWLGLCLLLGGQFPALALQVDKIYDIALPVADRSVSQQKVTFKQAFAEVLLRLTGEQEVLALPEIVAATEQVDKYVSSYAYLSEMLDIKNADDKSERDETTAVNQQAELASIDPKARNANSKTESTEATTEDPTANATESSTGAEAEKLNLQQLLAGSKEKINLDFQEAAKQAENKLDAATESSKPESILKLEIKFDEKMITNLLKKNKIKFLAKDRPLTVIWLALDDQTSLASKTELVGEENFPEITAKLEKIAASKKTPIILPLLDLLDKSLIQSEDILTAKFEKLAFASKRYDADVILTGNLINTHSGWDSTWQLPGENLEEWSISAENLTEQFDKSLDLLLKNLVNRYATTAQDFAKAKVMLRVSGIEGLEGYNKVLTYLNKLSIVNKVEEVSISQDQAVFALRAEGSKEAVVKLIKMDKVLEKMPANDNNHNLVEYKVYKWN